MWLGTEDELTEPDSIGYLTIARHDGARRSFLLLLFGRPNDPAGLRILPHRYQWPVVDGAHISLGHGWGDVERAPARADEPGSSISR